MYLKSQTIRKPDGRAYTYYRLVESYRDQGTVKHRVIAELGRLTAEEAEKLARRFAQVAGRSLFDEEELEIEGSMYFGPPLLVEHLMDQLHLTQWVEQGVAKRRVKFDVVAALKLMLCAHLFKSGSRAELAVWDWQQKLFGHDPKTNDLDYSHLLRSLHVLVQIKNQIEEKMFLHLVDLFDLKVDLVFYDLTSSYVEGQADWSELLRRGYSSDKRGDCKQVVIGLVVTQEGFPVTYRVFRGNRLHKHTLKEMVAELKTRFQITRCIWVSDAGLLSKENEKLLKDSGYEYVLGMGGENHKEAKQAFRQVSSLEQKEFKDTTFWEVKASDLDEGKDGEPEDDSRRLVVVESEGRRKKTSAIFERRLTVVREGLQKLEKKVKAGKCVEANEIEVEAEKVLHECRVKKYFSYELGRGVFAWQEDRTAVEARKANAGKYALLTNSALPPEQVLSAYRTLLTVEDAFLVLKHVLDLRPFWHKCDDNVEGHVLLAVWSYLLYKTLEQRLKQKSIELSVPRVLNAIKEVKAVEVAIRDRAIWKLMKVPAEAEKAFAAIGLDDIKSHFKKWAKHAPPYHYCPRLEPDYPTHDA